MRHARRRAYRPDPILVGVVGALLAGCGIVPIGSGASRSGGSSPAVNLISAPEVPGAQGRVDAKLDKNGNAKLKITVEHLADPQQLSPPAAAYVVWTRSEGSSKAANIGTLKVDRNLKGALETVSALRSFDLFITAEDSPIVDAPSGDRLLWTRVEAR